MTMREIATTSIRKDFSMDELILNAQLDHWPPHLGVRTDAEKIQYLAQRLREAVVRDNESIDELNRHILTLEQANDMLQSEIDTLNLRLSKIAELAQ